MSNFNQNAEWRYATKKFDATKKVSDQDLETLKKAISLTATSYGLEPYKILIVENPETRQKLQAASWNQSQVTEASHLLVFANIVNFGNEQMDTYFDNLTKTRQIPTEAVQGYSDFMKSNINAKSSEDKNIWTAKQAYLAMNNLINACAELKIDATPMEGFSPEQYNQILELDKLGLNAVLVTPIGYRSTEDQTQFAAKVRKPYSELFINL